MIQPIASLDRFTESKPGTFVYVIASRRLVLMPLGLGKGLQRRVELVGKSGRGNRARKEPQAGPFHVYAFQAADIDENGNPEDVTLSFNLSGIRMNEDAFKKLQQEISLEPLKVKLPASFASSDKGEYGLYSATVPVDRDIFRKIVVRESRIPRIDSADFSVKGWTERRYYEICTDAAIYAALESDLDAALALSILLLAISFGLLVFFRRWLTQAAYGVT